MLSDYLHISLVHRDWADWGFASDHSALIRMDWRKCECNNSVCVVWILEHKHMAAEQYPACMWCERWKLVELFPASDIVQRFGPFNIFG